MYSSLDTNGYDELINAVLDYNTPNVYTTESRMGPTTEVLGLQVRTSPNGLVHRSGINYRIGWMELVQLIAGIYDKSGMRRAAPNADHALFTEPMAYGPRLVLQSGEQPMASCDWSSIRNPAIVQSLQQPAIDQLRRVLTELMDNRSTRQAVISIARPWELCSSDMPCTLSIQFLRRCGILHCVVTMRSWDLIKGLPYDLMMFGGLHQLMAHLCGAITGGLIVNAASAHVYEADVNRVPTNKIGAFYMPRFVTLAHYRAWADEQIEGDWAEQKGGVPLGIKVIDHNRVITRKS